jgi:hypothetical protein
VRQPRNEKRRRSARFSPQGPGEVRVARPAAALDVVGRGADEPGIFFPARNLVVSGSELCRAGQRTELRRGSVRRESVSWRADQSKSMDRNRRRLRRRHHRLVEPPLATPRFFGELKGQKFQGLRYSALKWQAPWRRSS